MEVTAKAQIGTHSAIRSSIFSTWTRSTKNPHWLMNRRISRDAVEIERLRQRKIEFFGSMRYHTSCHSRFSKRFGIQEINSSEFQLGVSLVHIYDLFLRRNSKAANLAENLLSIRIATFRIFGAIDTGASPVPLTNTPIGLCIVLQHGLKRS